MYFHSDMSHSIENRRQFFEKFAKENKFDPHNSDNWFNRSRKDIIAASQVYHYFIILIFFKKYVIIT